MPVIFWSVFFSIWTAFILYIKGDVQSAPGAVAKGVILGKPYYHLWYLFMIPFLYAITPVLRLAMNGLKQRELLAFIGFCFSLSICNALFNSGLAHFDMGARIDLFTNNFLPFVGYFVLGGYIHKFNISVAPKICTMSLLVAWLVTIFGSYFLSYEYFYSYLSVNTVIASLSVFFLIKHYADVELKMGTFSLYSFGIYLVHPIFLDGASLLIRDKMLSVMNAFFYIPLASVIVFVLSYGAVLIMSRIRFLKRCI